MTSGLRTSAQPLVCNYDLVLLDLDGVVYLGEQPIPGAAEAVAATRAGGVRVAFVTNNASRTPEVVAAQLTGLGISAGPGDVVTAAQAAVHLLADRLPAGSSVLVTGSAALVAAVSGAGFTVVPSADDRPAAVVSGYAGTLTYPDLAEAALAVRAGALWVAANLDATMPSPRGLLPGNGALVAAVAVATGQRPVSAGKPQPALYDEAVRRTGGRRPLVVGDRLDTDIAGAAAAGLDSLLVLTGVSRPADLLHAEAASRPTYIGPDLSGLLLPHPAPRLTGSVATCAGWSAILVDSTLEVRPPPGPPSEPARLPVDGLRAACAVAWAAADAGRLPPDVQVVGLALG